MKPGFGSKKNKKKKQRKPKSKQNADAVMDDGGTTVPVDGIDEDLPNDTTGISAKERHKHKVQLKTALKVKVAKLKQARAKLTKIPGNKVQRKEVSEAKQEALLELHELQKDKTQKKAGKKKKKNKRGAAGGAAGDGAQPSAAAGAEAMEAD